MPGVNSSTRNACRFSWMAVACKSSAARRTLAVTLSVIVPSKVMKTAVLRDSGVDTGTGVVAGASSAACDETELRLQKIAQIAATRAIPRLTESAVIHVSGMTSGTECMMSAICDRVGAGPPETGEPRQFTWIVSGNHWEKNARPPRQDHASGWNCRLFPGVVVICLAGNGECVTHKSHGTHSPPILEPVGARPNQLPESSRRIHRRGRGGTQRSE